MKTLLTSDPWLSERLAKASCVLDPTSGWGLTADIIGRVIEACPKPAFISCKLPAFEIEAAHALQDTGFRLVDTAVTLERPFTSLPFSAAAVRLARPADREAVAAVAGKSFAFSRFHQDPRIARETADRIKAEWAANFFSGRRGDTMVVAEHDGAIGGFLQLLHRGPALVIDLLAVAPPLRRRGLAAAMIAYALNHLSGFALVRTGTQAVNTASLRLYQKLDFRIVDVQYVFHLHTP